MNSILPIDCDRCVLRNLRDDDVAALVRHANDARVAATLRDRFPHPYTDADARAWLQIVKKENEGLHLVIDVAGELIGMVGLEPQKDINTGTAEIGYWLGQTFWGRGITTAAVTTLSRYALTDLGYRRLFATALAPNAASRRVLEKAGYQLEGILRRSAIKQGVMFDQALYSLVDDDLQ